jgi:hypothetical protein
LKLGDISKSKIFIELRISSPFKQSYLVASLYLSA